MFISMSDKSHVSAHWAFSLRASMKLIFLTVEFEYFLQAFYAHHVGTFVSWEATRLDHEVHAYWAVFFYVFFVVIVDWRKRT